jgi:hypothetical protein
LDRHPGKVPNSVRTPFRNQDNDPETPDEILRIWMARMGILRLVSQTLKASSFKTTWSKWMTDRVIALLNEYVEETFSKKDSLWISESQIQRMVIRDITSQFETNLHSRIKLHVRKEHYLKLVSQGPIINSPKLDRAQTFRTVGPTKH